MERTVRAKAWLSAAILMSAFLYIPTFGKDVKALADYTVTDNAPAPDAYTESLVYGKNALFIGSTSDGVETDFTAPLTAQGKNAQLTDGVETPIDLALNKFMSGSPPALRNGVVSGYRDDLAIYEDYIYYLGDGGKQVEQFYIRHHAHGYMCTYQFEVYIADRPYDLGKEAFLAASVTNSARAYTHLIDFTQPVKGAYLMLRITNAVMYDHGDANSSTVRLSEIAVFGSAANTTVVRNPQDASSVNFSQSLLHNATPILCTVYDTQANTTANFVKDNLNMAKNISDGSLSTVAELSSASNYTASEKMRNAGKRLNIYTDIAYRLCEAQESVEIDSVWLFGTTANGLSGSYDLDSYQYEVYVSDSKDTLTDVSSLVVSALNVNSSSDYSGIQKIVFDQPVEGTYLLLRITNAVQPVILNTRPGSNSGISYARVRELAVFGTRTSGTVTISHDVSPSDLTESLIYQKKAVGIVTHSDASSTAVNYDHVWQPLTDGNASTATEISMYQATVNKKLRNQITTTLSDTPVVYDDIIYSLADGGFADVEQFYIKHMPVGHELTTYQYEIYIADTQAELGTLGSLAASVTNGGKNGSQIITFGEPVTGVYLMLRVVNSVQPVTTYADASNYLRLFEIAVFGSVAPAPPDPLTVKYSVINVLLKKETQQDMDIIDEVYGSGKEISIIDLLVLKKNNPGNP